MKVRSILSFLIFLIIRFNLYANTIFTSTYSVSGIGIGKTKIKGSFTVKIKPLIKYINGDLYFQEVDNPFPDKVTKKVYIDFNNKIKKIKIGDIKKGMETPLGADYNSIQDSEISTSIFQKEKLYIMIIEINSKNEDIGKQKYFIEFDYSNAQTTAEEQFFSKFQKPTTADILSFFIDNEKIIDTIGRKMPYIKNKFPVKFSLKWEENGVTQLNINGELKVKTEKVETANDFNF